MEDCIYLENSVLGRIIHIFKMESVFCFKQCLRKQSLHPNKKNSTWKLNLAVHSQEINLLPECIKTWLLVIHT